MKKHPRNACAGIVDTGTWYDSPSPSRVAIWELKLYTEKLQEAGIPYKTKNIKTSNFCVHRYITTTPEFKQRAAEIAESIKDQTRLLYSIKN